MSVDRSASPVCFYIIIAVVDIARSQDEASAVADTGYWYGADGSRHDCSFVEHPYEQLLCPCEKNANAVIACKSYVHLQGRDCWSHREGVAECDRRRGLTTASSPSLAVRNFTLSSLGLRLNASLDNSDRTIVPFPSTMDSAINDSEETSRTGAAPAIDTTGIVTAVIVLCGGAAIAMLVLFLFMKGKNKRRCSTNNLEAGEALQMCVVKDSPD